MRSSRKVGPVVPDGTWRIDLRQNPALKHWRRRVAALLDSPEGCRKLAGDNIPGNRAAIPSRPEGALELSPGMLTDQRMSIKPESGQIKPTEPESNQNQADSNQKMESQHSVILSKFRSAPLRLCVKKSALKIKNLLQKIKISSSNPIKPNQGFIDEKNSEFFLGHFYRKSLENPAKNGQKTPQITP